MANNTRWATIGLACVVISLSHVACTSQHGKKEELIRQLDTFTPNTIVRLQGKLAHNNSLEQNDSNFCDLLEYSDLILSLLRPAISHSSRPAHSPVVCNLKIESRDGSVVSLNVLWTGNGNLVYTNDASLCYRRQRESQPEPGEKYLDEAIALCGLIQATIDKDERRAQTLAAKLLSAVGSK